jgi:hypothetical protein
LTEARDITAYGRTQSISAWQREFGLHRGAIESRLKAGHSPEDAVSRGHISEAKELWPGANDLPFEADVIAQKLVNWHGPFTLETIGECLGITRERVRQVEARAFRKFREACALEGIDATELLAELREREAR